MDKLTKCPDNNEKKKIKKLANKERLKNVLNAQHTKKEKYTYIKTQKQWNNIIALKSMD